VTLRLFTADLGPGVRAGFTGTGGSPAFNLSVAVGDDQSAVLARRARLETWVGAPVAFARQVHGSGVHVCGAPELAELVTRRDGSAAAEPVAEADALVTQGPDLAVAVLVADCVPILIADVEAGVVAAVHCGRRGLVAGVVPATVRAMADLGATRLWAAVGPAICGACYEVPDELQQEVADAVPGTACRTSVGSPGLDLPRGVRGQLVEAGVDRTTMLDACTLEDQRWFSHRGLASGRPVGRSAAVVRVLPRG